MWKNHPPWEGFFDAVHGPPPDGGASARRAVGRVAKRVVLGMNSWQTRVLLSKKEVTQSVRRRFSNGWRNKRKKGEGKGRRRREEGVCRRNGTNIVLCCFISQAFYRVKLRSGRAPGRSGLFFGARRRRGKFTCYGNLSLNRIYTTFE